MKTHAVIFDMDGLLIDTEPVWRQVERTTFASLGLHLTEEQCMELMGVRADDVTRIWYSRFPWAGPSPDEVTRRIVRGVIERVTAEGEPMPGVRRAMETVARAALPIAIASSSSTDLIDAVIDRLDLRRFISAIASAEHEKEGKPHPAVYRTAAAALGVPPDTCVALEDSPNGVLSAKAAGMYCIAVPDRYLRGDERLEQADATIASLEHFSLDLLPGFDSVGEGVRRASR